jgi:hypothetical protein
MPSARGTINAADAASTRATRYSVCAVDHPVDDDADFRPLAIDVENTFADAIVTAVCCIGLQGGVFGLTPVDGKFGCFPDAKRGPSHDFLSPAQFAGIVAA